MVASSVQSTDAAPPTCEPLSASDYTRAAAQIAFDEPTVVIADWPATRSIDPRGVRPQLRRHPGNILVALDEPGLAIEPSEQRTTQNRAPNRRSICAALEHGRSSATLAECCRRRAHRAVRRARCRRRLPLTAVDGPGRRAADRTPATPTNRRVDWEAMIRQIANTYRLSDDNETANWVAAAGPVQFLREMSSSKARRWAVTGSFAANLVSVSTHDDRRSCTPTTPSGSREPATPPHPNQREHLAALLTMTCVPTHLGTRPAARFASLCQVTVDCLTGFGRMPQEGEALLDWMRRRSPKWAAPSLADAPHCHDCVCPRVSRHPPSALEDPAELEPH